jgi:site-specific DNA-methyltransferase (adenine-specific)
MKYQLFNDDCFNIFTQIEDKSIDLIICDPPYGVTQNSWDKLDTPNFLNKLWGQYERIVKNNGVIAIFGMGLFGANLVVSNPDMFRYELIWDKQLVSGFLNANRQPLRVHENIYIFYKKQPVYNPQFTKSDKKLHSRGNIDTLKFVKNNKNYGGYKYTESRQETDKYPVSILSFQRVSSGKNVHPTQKPVELIEWLIKTYSNEDSMVLDNMMGSGTTGVACVNCNRNFIGIEKDTSYFEIAKNRIEKAKNTYQGFVFA